MASWWANQLGLYGGNNILIEDNLFRDCVKKTGMELSGYGGPVLPANCTVQFNTILRGGSYGYAADQPGMIIEGNGTNMTVNDNTISDSMFEAVQVSSSTYNLLFEDNLITAPGTTGIIIPSGTEGTGAFLNNRVESLNSGQSAYINDATSTFTATQSGNSWQSLVLNGNFESPSTSGFITYGAGSTALTDWTVDTSPSDGVQLGMAGEFGVNNGAQNLQLTGGSTYSVGGGISQTIDTTSGETYTVSIEVAARSSAPANGNFSFGGQNYALSAPSKTNFTTLTWSVTATNSSTVINITGDPHSATEQLLIDNVSVAGVPAPVINTTAISAGVLTFSGTNGAPSGAYYVFGTTNLALPISQWTVVTNGTYNGSGNFSVSAPVSLTAPAQFYSIGSP